MKIRSATFFHEPRNGKKVAKNRFFLICDACKKTKDSPQSKGLSYFYKTLYYGVNKSRYSIFLLRSMEGTIFPFHLLKST